MCDFDLQKFICIDTNYIHLFKQTSGKEKLKWSELGYGLHQTLRSHGNGENIDVTVDDQLLTM